MYENIFLTGLVLVVLMLAIPKVVGDDVPSWVKSIIIIPGLLGFASMIISLMFLIWAD